LKRRDSKYEPGLRAGAWQKMRVNHARDLVIAGYTPSLRNFDALIIGYTKARSYFTLPGPAAGSHRPLQIKDCPFANLPEKNAGRWGAGLTAAKMAECRWPKPELVGQFEFVQWTGENHLRHAKFIRVRDDKRASEVVKASAE
jgi:ATP-dependent DNA ligase